MPPRPVSLAGRPNQVDRGAHVASSQSGPALNPSFTGIRKAASPAQLLLMALLLGNAEIALNPARTPEPNDDQKDRLV
jgi:hypothetical protein